MNALLDDISRITASSISRREAFKLVGGAVGGALLAYLGVGRASRGLGAQDPNRCPHNRPVPCNGNCYPSGYSCCGRTVCNTGQTCINGRCCPSAQVCNGTCCPSDQRCISGNCCPSARICSGTCCTSGQTCIDGKCCPSAQSCNGVFGIFGRTCCPSGQTCCNGRQCCPSGQCCDNRTCCPPDEACCHDRCVRRNPSGSSPCAA